MCGDVDGDANTQSILGISKRAGNRTPSKGRSDAFRETAPQIVTSRSAIYTARHGARTPVLSNQFANPLDYQEFYLPLEWTSLLHHKHFIQALSSGLCLSFP